MNIKWAEGARPTLTGAIHCDVCDAPDSSGMRQWFAGSVDGGPVCLLTVCPDDLGSPRIGRANLADIKSLYARMAAQRPDPADLGEPKLTRAALDIVARFAREWYGERLG